MSDSYSNNTNRECYNKVLSEFYKVNKFSAFSSIVGVFSLFAPAIIYMSQKKVYNSILELEGMLSEKVTITDDIVSNNLKLIKQYKNILFFSGIAGILFILIALFTLTKTI